MPISDTRIKQRVESGSLDIDPYVDEHVEPASVDLRLGSDFKRIIGTGEIIDTREKPTMKMKTIDSDSVVLKPGDAMLGTTVERISLPDDLSARVVGRSSLGRLFVEVHKTAGFGDPGFEGEVTLELMNGNPNPVRLHAGDRICQIVFEPIVGAVEQTYGSETNQYQGQSGATESGMSFESKD